MKNKILTLLKESENYISGQDICNLLGVSRTAVWKIINQLKEEGYVIEAVSNKGYHLINCPDTLHAPEVISQLKTRYIGKKIAYYEQLGSTNNEAKKLAEEGGEEGLLIISEEQLSGKGRRGRDWTSPAKEGIWMSFVLRPAIAPNHASMMTLLAALAVNKGIESVLGAKTLIKWPNDIVLNNKKICGILTEMSTELDYVNYVVIGIGINANIGSFPKELREKATSLKLEGFEVASRAKLVAAILKEFEVLYEQFIERKTLDFCKDEYNKYLINCEREVKIIERDNSYIAKSLGIDELGQLLVRTDDNEIKAIFSGEVSVRGLYGYV